MNLATPPPIGNGESPPGRRTFLKGIAAFALSGVAIMVPASTGLGVFLEPLRQRGNRADAFLRVASLQALPADGIPRRFAVIADKANVWNRTPGVPVGAVYLRRTGGSEVKAYNVTCPHAGCVVDYAPARGGFLCPCHNSTFALDGRVNDARSPSPRGLDELPVEIRNEREVWVQFQNYRPGFRERIPV